MKSVLKSQGELFIYLVLNTSGITRLETLLMELQSLLLLMDHLRKGLNNTKKPLTGAILALTTSFLIMNKWSMIGSPYETYLEDL